MHKRYADVSTHVVDLISRMSASLKRNQHHLLLRACNHFALCCFGVSCTLLSQKIKTQITLLGEEGCLLCLRWAGPSLYKRMAQGLQENGSCPLHGVRRAIFGGADIAVSFYIKGWHRVAREAVLSLLRGQGGDACSALAGGVGGVLSSHKRIA